MMTSAKVDKNTDVRSLIDRVDDYGVQLHQLVPVKDGSKHKAAIEMKGSKVSINVAFKTS
jgi:hypothetical protein